VNPGATLSLQKHMHRAEHWIVVKGTALVTKGKDVITLSENESTYIPLGIRHRLENPGRIPLELIEVQSGSYLEKTISSASMTSMGGRTVKGEGQMAGGFDCFVHDVLRYSSSRLKNELL